MDTKNPLLVRLTGAPDFWRYTPVEMKAPYLKYKIIDGKKEKFSMNIHSPIVLSGKVYY